MATTKKKAPAKKKSASKASLAAKKKAPAKKTPAKKKRAPTQKTSGAKRAPAGRSPSAGAPGFDVDALLARIDRWSAEQRDLEVRLNRFPALSDEEIDRVPSLLSSFPFPLPTPYEPSRFRLPRGYRELLRRAGGMQLEFRRAVDEAWQTWPVLNLYRPGDCSHAHQGKGKTLSDSWTVFGTNVDDRAFTTSDFIAFADAGFAVEASRWCFFIGGEPAEPPSIYIEDNDFECLLGKYVDTGEWISDLHDPVFPSFEAWLTALVEVVCARPFEPDQNDATVNAIIEQGARQA